MVKKKTKGIKLNINISNRALYTIIAIAIILIAGGIVVAWNSNDPPVMGHTLGELQGCISGQILKSGASGKWACGADNSILGGCTSICDEFSINFVGCGYVWGSGSCTVAVPGGPCSIKCSCAQGALTKIGESVLYAGGTKDYGFQYVCVG